MPDGKALTTGENVAVNIKHVKAPKVFNINMYGMRDSGGRNHDQSPGVIMLCTNFGTKIGLEKDGYPRRLFIRRCHYVPKEPDAKLEELVKETCLAEIALCLHAWGKAKRMMRSSGNDGRELEFRHLFMDSSGKGLIERRTAEFFEAFNTDGAREQPNEWVIQYLQAAPNRYASLNDVYKRYRADSEGEYVTRTEFKVMCEVNGYEHLHQTNRNSVNVCKTCYDQFNLSYKKFSALCSCGHPKRFQRQHLLKNCIYNPNKDQ